MKRPARKNRSEAPELQAELRAAGLRATPARVAVLEAVRAAAGPLTHSEVTQALHRRGWNSATIFRNLVALADEGFLRRTDLGDHVWRFEAAPREHEAGPIHEHPHFLCTDCGAVECIPELELHVRGGRGLPRSVREHAVEVQLKGQCDACAG